MTSIQDLQTATQALNTAVQTYVAKPTKAQSKRLRALITQFKKEATSFKSALIEADKAN